MKFKTHSEIKEMYNHAVQRNLKSYLNEAKLITFESLSCTRPYIVGILYFLPLSFTLRLYHL